MREIKKIDLASAQSKVDSKKSKKAEPNFCGESEKSRLNDFSNPKAETLGRSQVNKTDNLKADIAFGIANPELVGSSDQLFEIAYEKFQKEGRPYAYEDACTVATAYPGAIGK